MSFNDNNNHFLSMDTNTHSPAISYDTFDNMLFDNMMIDNMMIGNNMSGNDMSGNVMSVERNVLTYLPTAIDSAPVDADPVFSNSEGNETPTSSEATRGSITPSLETSSAPKPLLGQASAETTEVDTDKASKKARPSRKGKQIGRFSCEECKKRKVKCVFANLDQACNSCLARNIGGGCHRIKELDGRTRESAAYRQRNNRPRRSMQAPPQSEVPQTELPQQYQSLSGDFFQQQPTTQQAPSLSGNFQYLSVPQNQLAQPTNVTMYANASPSLGLPSYDMGLFGDSFDHHSQYPGVPQNQLAQPANVTMYANASPSLGLPSYDMGLFDDSFDHHSQYPGVPQNQLPQPANVTMYAYESPSLDLPLYDMDFLHLPFDYNAYDHDQSGAVPAANHQLFQGDIQGIS